MQGKVMPESSTQAQLYAGIDVCKDRLDVYLHPIGEHFSVSNDAAGCARLKRKLARLPVTGVVMEATAKYHRLAHKQLSAAGFEVSVANPLRARLFAEAAGMLAKTDRVDAMMLARMGAALGLEATPPARARPRQESGDSREDGAGEPPRRQRDRLSERRAGTAGQGPCWPHRPACRRNRAPHCGRPGARRPPGHPGVHPRHRPRRRRRDARRDA